MKRATPANVEDDNDRLDAAGRDGDDDVWVWCCHLFEYHYRMRWK